MLRLFAVVLLLALATSARAVLVIEEYFEYTSPQSGTFGVRNTGPGTVVAFAVANDTLLGADGTHEFYRVWASGLISDTNWDAEKDIFEAAIGQSVPTFHSFFPGYHKAVVYWAHDILPAPQQAAVASLSWEAGSLRLRDPVNQSCPCYFSQPIPEGDDATYASFGELGFYFYATAPGSPFAALTVNPLTGEFAFVQGEVQLVPIPEPTAVAMMLAGLALLGNKLRKGRRITA